MKQCIEILPWSCNYNSKLMLLKTKEMMIKIFRPSDNHFSKQIHHEMALSLLNKWLKKETFTNKREHDNDSIIIWN